MKKDITVKVSISATLNPDYIQCGLFSYKLDQLLEWIEGAAAYHEIQVTFNKHDSEETE